LNSLDYPVLFPVHPRIKKAVKEITIDLSCDNIHFIEPLGYIDMIYFAKNAVKIITDSGGLHKEAFWLKVPSVVILRNTAWEETLNGNCNILTSHDGKSIIEKVKNTKIDYECFNNSYYGDGKAGEKIVNYLGV
jgi:UDP-N-acetylglucosamine 2-epimerase (non-hydrolysing)/UDP-GlcNAc3NAcA epimerase